MTDIIEDKADDIGYPIDEDGQQLEVEDTKQRKSKLQDRLEWRRGKVAELSSQGFTIREIGEKLKVPKSSIGEDIQYLSQEARKNLAQYNERLPYEFESVMTGITSILKRSIQESQTAADTKTKMMCLDVAKDCYSMKLDLITNLSMLETAVKFLDNHKGRNQYTKGIALHSDLSTEKRYDDPASDSIAEVEEEEEEASVGSPSEEVIE